MAEGWKQRVVWHTAGEQGGGGAGHIFLSQGEAPPYQGQSKTTTKSKLIHKVELSCL